jgi:two-component system response regulator YesN
VPARRDRSLRRAVDYIERHYSEPLRLETVARIAGITPVYFSKLFKEREHVTFENYLRRLRIERAKQLLVNTGIGVSRVAEQSGFQSPQYFCRVFRSVTGQTPLAFRRQPLLDRPLRHGKKVQKKLARIQSGATRDPLG